MILTDRITGTIDGHCANQVIGVCTFLLYVEVFFKPSMLAW